MQTRLVESRRKLLEQFCSAVAAIPHLYHSEEFQVFCKGSRRYEDARLDYPSPSLQDIRVSYELLFAEAKPDPGIGWLKPEEVPQFQARVGEMMRDCVLVRGELKKMKLFARNLEQAMGRFQTGLQQLADTAYFEYTSGRPKQSLAVLPCWPDVRTFSPVLDWVKSEQVAIHCLVDTLHSRSSLSQRLNSLSLSLETSQVHYTYVQAGKRSLTDRLGLKPASLDGIRAEMEKVTSTQTEEDIKHIGTIAALADCWFLYREVAHFRQARRSAYEKAVKEFWSGNGETLHRAMENYREFLALQ